MALYLLIIDYSEVYKTKTKIHIFMLNIYNGFLVLSLNFINCFYLRNFSITIKISVAGY